MSLQLNSQPVASVCACPDNYTLSGDSCILNSGLVSTSVVSANGTRGCRPNTKLAKNASNLDVCIPQNMDYAITCNSLNTINAIAQQASTNSSLVTAGLVINTINKTLANLIGTNEAIVRDVIAPAIQN